MIDAIMHEYKHGAAEVIASAWPGAHNREIPMNKKSIKAAEARLSRAGFHGWQIAAYRGWLKNLSNRRKWREMTEKTFGVRV